MKPSKSKIKIYYNKKLFVSFLVALACCVMIDVFITWVILKEGPPIIPAAIGVVVAFWGLTLVFVIIALYTGCNAHMVFTKEGIEYRQVLKKTVVHSYRGYAYVNKAFYMYFGMPMYYMVLSNRRLREAERCQINNVGVSDMMLKIRYNKKNYEAIMSIVPSRIALSLQSQFKDIPPKRFNFFI